MGKVAGLGFLAVAVVAFVVKYETGISVAVWIHRFFGGN